MHLNSDPNNIAARGPVKSTDTWIPVKITTGEKSLQTFMKNWKEGPTKGMPFNGEIEPPNAAKDPYRQVEIDPCRISLCVLDVDDKTYDKTKGTVMVKIRPTGPYGEFLAENMMKNKARFIARTVTVRKNGTDEREKRIVTIDSVLAPGVRVDK